MHDWTDGYVADIEYSAGFYADQTPPHLDAACLVRGIEPPVPPGQPYRYCELGCGVGQSAAAIAATAAHASVWAFDFNPAHIVRGQAFARDAGLDNLTLEEASFEDLAGWRGQSLPRFHYIALHGVWAWVSPANRHHIVKFIAAHLEPGGLVYITYNALPGWNSVVPMQRALRSMAEFDHGRSDHRVVGALARLRRMADAGARTILPEHLEHLEQERTNDNDAYLAHEYMNVHWAPCYQQDVAAALAAAKVSFAASANIFDNFPELCLSEEQRALVNETPADFRETMRDYFMTRTFRRDIYIRGSRPIPPRRLDRRLRGVRLTAVIPPTALQREIDVPSGKAELNAGFYESALDMIAIGAPTVGELLDDPRVATATATPQEIIGMLIGSRQAMSVVQPQPMDSAVERIRRYNATQMQSRAEAGRAAATLGGLAIGSAITVRLFEMLVYEALAEGVATTTDAIVDNCWQRLQSRGDRLVDHGALVEDEAANRQLLQQNVPEILTTAVPIWRRIGAI